MKQILVEFASIVTAVIGTVFLLLVIGISMAPGGILRQMILFYLESGA